MALKIGAKHKKCIYLRHQTLNNITQFNSIYYGGYKI